MWLILFLLPLFNACGSLKKMFPINACYVVMFRKSVAIAVVPYGLFFLEGYYHYPLIHAFSEWQSSTLLSC